LYNEKIAKQIVPDKYAITRSYYLKFIETAVDIFGNGKVQSLLLVGLEPIEDTLKGVKELARIGCIPVLSPFCPGGQTPLENHPRPTAETLISIYEESDAICRVNGIKLGPRCKPCQHNTLTFPDSSNFYITY